MILSLLLFDTGCSALCEAAREEAGCAALPGALLDTGRSALFEAAREEASRFIAVVTMDAGKTLEPHVRTISCMQEKLKRLCLSSYGKLQISDSRFQISDLDFRFQISDCRLQISELIRAGEPG